MAKLVLLAFLTLLGVFNSESLLNGNLCQTQYIDLYRQPVGSLHVIVPDLDTDCTIQLNTEWGFSVVLSILQYYVPDTHLLSVEDSDGFKISLLGQGLFQNNRKALLSERKMKIRYLVDKRYAAQTTPSTINGTETELDNSTELFDANNTVVTVMNETAHSSTRFGFFHFIYTQVGNAPCGKSEFACQNGKCLPKIYVCSGHNRCGDNSDNMNCGPVPTVEATKITSIPTVSLNQTVVIICTGVLVIVLLLSAYIIASVRRSKKPNNSTLPLQSVSSNVGAPTDHQPPRSPSEEASASVCSRMQHFFQKKEDKEEENLQNLPSERFQVPSMYPSLQPTAPEYGNTLGRENRGFSVERD